MLAALQNDFAQALLDPDRDVPGAITSHNAREPQQRFAVYRNNVVAGLIDAVRAKFPATERIVGEAFFAAMARMFVTAHPPRSKILHHYGDDFGNFVEGFEPAAALPYLADVARLEAARTRAYHAADAVPLPPAAFAKIDPQYAGLLRLTLHPSLQIVRSAYPIVTIWGMNAGEIALGPINQSAPEDAIVMRPSFNVTVRVLPPGGATFIAALRDKATLATASEAAAASGARCVHTASLALLIDAGAIVAFAMDDRDRTGSYEDIAP